MSASLPRVAVRWVVGIVMAARLLGAEVEPPNDRPLQSPGQGYVTSASCAECHHQQHATWHDSYHRTMTQEARPGAVLADFDGREVVLEGRRYKLERQGDEFWVEMDDSFSYLNRQASPKRVRNHIVLLTGSHHMQVYWFASGVSRILEQLPIVFLLEEKRWVPSSSTFLFPPKESMTYPGLWNSTCIKCHTTHSELRRMDRAVMDTRVAQFGIACEACHGPAEKHVEFYRKNPEAKERKGADATIVQPENLPPALSAQVCGQCHGIWDDPAETLARWNADGLPYRPGEDIVRWRNKVLPTAETFKKQPPAYPKVALDTYFWSDGMVRVSGREYNGLAASPCFQHAGGRQISCLSCHTLHQPASDARPRKEWADDQLRSGMAGNRGCLQCHEAIGAKLEAHTHHPAASTGSQCYNCHMPYTTYGLLKAIRSHQITNPTVQASVNTGRPNACNQCHLDKTLQWAADNLHQWYGTPKPALDADQSSVAAGILWTLKGDAGQRALMAWTMGWDAAKEASGTDWMGPYLAPLLTDPYDAVRFIAQRSLKRLPGYANVEYDFVGPAPQRDTAAQKVIRQWVKEPHPGKGRAALLLDADGKLQDQRVYQLYLQRNDRPVSLNE